MYKVTELRRLAETYIAATGIAANKLGNEISGGSNNRMITGLLIGRGLSGPSIETASDWFDARADREWWPADVPWPKSRAQMAAE